MAEFCWWSELDSVSMSMNSTIFASGHRLPEVADFAGLQFSTTGPVEQAAFSMGLMGMLKVYFEYAMNCICGIPEITLKGPKIIGNCVWPCKNGAALRRTGGLDPLEPILIEFERADRVFWNDLYQRHDPLGGGYGGPLQQPRVASSGSCKYSHCC
ncbi:MAG: DUF4419 domain-containing protein [Candidatus Eremiobacteraeota bacterium]|nr:DUF4419 domain-containing protein [Candidatus Eremiobacteraeota bacterium]MCW5871450.1 DUF4419 domain-containing protein [Candidatus Eremiobacteraeota bacterium]